MGAGLKSSMARMRDKATSDLKGTAAQLARIAATMATARGSSCRPLAAAELTQVLLPGGSQGHLELQALQDAAALEGSQLGGGPRQQRREDRAKVLVYLQERNNLTSSLNRGTYHVIANQKKKRS